MYGYNEQKDSKVTKRFLISGCFWRKNLSSACIVYCLLSDWP